VRVGRAFIFGGRAVVVVIGAASLAPML